MNEVEKSKRLRTGPVYLMDEFEGCVLKSTAEGEVWYVKWKGNKEAPIHHSTKLVTDAFLEWNEITEKEYNEF